MAEDAPLFRPNGYGYRPTPQKPRLLKASYRVGRGVRVYMPNLAIITWYVARFEYVAGSAGGSFGSQFQRRRRSPLWRMILRALLHLQRPRECLLLICCGRSKG